MARVFACLACGVLLIASLPLTANSGAPTQTRLEAVDVSEFCDLIHKADSYHGKTVRVKTSYVVGSEMSMVANSDCMGIRGEGDVWVNFDSNFKYWSKREVVKRLEELLQATPKKPDGSSIQVTSRGLAVVFVGKFANGRRFGHMGAYTHQLTVYAVEEVKPLSWLLEGEQYYRNWPDTP